MSWRKTTIGEHCTVTSSKRFHAAERATSGIPFYCSKEIIQKANGEEVTECDYIREDLYEDVKRQFGVPETGDLLITSRGTYGVPYIYKNSDKFYFADGNLTWLKDFDDELNVEYLYYWIRTYEGQKKIDAIAKGTAQKAVPIATLKLIELSIPNIKTQKKIVAILKEYDKLIENNQKQIKLLEEAARRLYKEWFVDLKFPNYEKCKIVDGIPNGWRKVTLGDICVLRKETLKPEKIKKGIPYIGLEHMPRKDICLAEWGDSSDVNSNKFQCYENDVIFGKIRPYFHKVGYALVNCICSTDAIIMVAEEGVWGLLLLITSSVHFVDYTYKTCKEGAKMPRADWNAMKKYPVLVAIGDIQKEFEKNIWTITRRMKSLALQNRKLAEARERLLQKLMSKEIEV